MIPTQPAKIHTNVTIYKGQKRVIIIADISQSDRNLSLEKQQEKLDDIAVELQMSYASQFDRHWIYKVAIAVLFKRN